MNRNIERIIDANINRLKEGLRVIEEWCRFGLDNKNYSSICKKSRHEVVEIIAQSKLSFSTLISSRDTQGDVGVSLTSKIEDKREDISSVLKANFNRIQEALRVLEEYSKLFISGQSFEKIRYDMYTLEKNIFTENKKGILKSSLYVLLSEDLCERPLLDCLGELLDAGARLFQLREKDKSDRAYFETAANVLDLVKQYDGVVIINDNLSVAQTVKADGVHLGLNDLPPRTVKDLVPSDFIIGATVHSQNELKDVPDFVDYVGIGPCFASQTKSDLEHKGLDAIRKIHENSSFNSFMIGGIGAANIGSLLSLGFKQFAICSAIIGSSSPGQEFDNLVQLIEEETKSE